MLYEMLCGRLPFDGTAVAIAKAHLASEVPPVAVRVPGLRVDPRLEAVSMRLMAKDPEERFQSARALLAHLDSAYGSADAQDGEDHDATVQVGSDSIPVTAAPSGEQYPIEAFRMTPYGMPELAASGRRARVRDPRVLITGGAVLITLVVVAVAMLWRGGGERPTQARAPGVSVPPAAAAEPPGTVPATEPPGTVPATEPVAPPPGPEPEPAAAPEPPSEPSSTAEPQPVPVDTAPAAEPDEPDEQDARDKAREEARDRRSRAREKRIRSARRASQRAERSRRADREEREADVEPPKPEPAAVAPAPPEPDRAVAAPEAAAVISTKEFLSRYKAIGARLERIVARRGEAAVSKVRLRYQEIPVADAMRSESVRRDADRTLKSITSRLDKDFGKL
jgi:serine/threonine-protein kinase